MYEKDPYHVNDLIDGSGVNVGVGTNNTWWCRSRTCGRKEMKRHLKTKIKMALVGFMEIDPFQARY